MKQTTLIDLELMQKRLSKAAVKKFGKDASVSIYPHVYPNRLDLSFHIWKDNAIIGSNFTNLTTKQAINWIKGL